ncbi:MAG: L,D-transpeptidase family protein [Ignavibacteriales bacterium]|nr:L,D-transpeptidase family protein [Ignavibacteriales bacterium]
MNRFISKDSSFQISSSKFEYFDTLKYFYTTRNFEPLYIKSFDDKQFLDSIMVVLNKVVEHGIDPNLYNYDLIKDEFSKIRNNNYSANSERYAHLANLELLLSDAVLKYAYHMRYGIVDPTKIFPESYFLPIADSSKKDLFAPLNQKNTFKYLAEIQPKSERYKKLQLALNKFQKLKNLDWGILSVNDNKLNPDEKISRLKSIAERLYLLGLLDTSKIVLKDFNVADSIFVKAIAKFQSVNGLPDNGILNKLTIEKLNTSPLEYVEKIKLNLERFRWTNYSDSTRYVLVNIPDFNLSVVENKQEKFRIKVCTGKKRPLNYESRLKLYEKTKNWRNKPNDWETPLLYGQISHLILNPTWTVPPSIIRDELYRKSISDSNYLQKQNFKVFLKGKQVSLNELDLSKYSPNNVPFVFVQDPGAGNALGKIKFIFTNKFNIYLHDTPTRAPFSYTNRAVSHGCVRVEKPLLLADYILKDNSDWNIDYIKIEIGSTIADKTKIIEYKQKRNELRKYASFGKTTQVKLDKNIPLFIDYFTAWVNEEGIVNFRDDVYGKDNILKKYILISN